MIYTDQSRRVTLLGLHGRVADGRRRSSSHSPAGQRLRHFPASTLYAAIADVLVFRVRRSGHAHDVGLQDCCHRDNQPGSHAQETELSWGCADQAQGSPGGPISIVPLCRPKTSSGDRNQGSPSVTRYVRHAHNGNRGRLPPTGWQDLLARRRHGLARSAKGATRYPEYSTTCSTV